MKGHDQDCATLVKAHEADTAVVLLSIPGGLITLLAPTAHPWS
jgi:hypothetical protein